MSDNSIFNQSENSDAQGSQNLNFMPGIPGSQPPKSNLNNPSSNPFDPESSAFDPGDTLQGDIKDLLNKGYTWARREGERYLVQKTEEGLRYMFKRVGDKFIKVMNPPKVVDGGSGGSKRRGSSSYSPSEHRGVVDYEPNPIRWDLNTGIEPKVDGDHFHDPLLDRKSYLHITGAKLSLAENDGYLTKYFEEVVAPNFYNAVQAAVKYNVNYSDLTPEKIRDWFNAITYSLQVYYFFDATLAYCSDPDNHNAGMRYLRKQITPQDFNDFQILKEKLAGMAIPPNLSNFCWYLMQVFAQTQMPGSSLMRICPVRFVNGLQKPDTGEISTCINELNNVRETGAALTRAITNWKRPVLPGSSIVPIYDPQFSTIFANLPIVGQNADGWFDFPSASSTDGNITYLSYTNELDGSVFALTSIFKESSGAFYPTCIRGIDSKTFTDGDENDIYSNRFSYYNPTGNVFKFVDVINDDGTYDGQPLRYSRGETLVYNGSSGYLDQFHKYGTEIVTQVNIASVTQTCYAFINWVLSASSIKKANDRSPNSRPKSKRKGGGNKSNK